MDNVPGPPLPYIKLIGNVACLTTIIQFLSGVLVCKQYIRNNTTGDASALPFIFGVTSTGIWLIYGLIIEDSRILFVNFVGICLMTGYLIIFYKYAFKKRDVGRQILMSVVFGALLITYLTYEEDIARLKLTTGVLACSLTLLTVAAPLVKLFHVMRVKNTECLPFQMILMSFFVSTIWAIYGYLNRDNYLLVANSICGVLASVQLSLFVIYPSRPSQMALLKTVHA